MEKWDNARWVIAHAPKWNYGNKLEKSATTLTASTIGAISGVGGGRARHTHCGHMS